MNEVEISISAHDGAASLSRTCTPSTRVACAMPAAFEAAQSRWLDATPAAPTISSLASERVAVCMVGATRTLLLPSCTAR